MHSNQLKEIKKQQNEKWSTGHHAEFSAVLTVGIN